MTSEERRQARYERRKAKRDARRAVRAAQYDTFDRVADSDNLYDAFKAAQKGVAWKESVQRYEANLLKNIAETRKKLLAGESIQNGFVEFDLHERGKVRHIKSVHISERVAQKCLCDQVLVPILTRTLIYDNGASVKGKGLHFAITRLITHLSRFYRKHQSNNGYALVVDFSKFFDSIDHIILFRLLDEQIQDEKTRELTRRFISVFGAGKSLGLGSQVSQIAAVFYPSPLDHYIKEVLQIKYYGRYMDDLYLIHRDRSYLVFCLERIRDFCGELKITINDKKTKIVSLAKGMLFLKGKYSLLPSGKVLRRPCKESALRQRRKLKKFKALLNEGKMSVEDIRNAYQSWRGNFMRRFDAYHTVRRMDALYNELFL
jgi:hypothetical protein